MNRNFLEIARHQRQIQKQANKMDRLFFPFLSTFINKHKNRLSLSRYIAMVGLASSRFVYTPFLLQFLCTFTQSLVKYAPPKRNKKWGSECKFYTHIMWKRGKKQSKYNIEMQFSARMCSIYNEASDFSKSNLIWNKLRKQFHWELIRPNVLSCDKYIYFVCFLRSCVVCSL